MRIYYLDVLKGIGIILMIMGHVGFGKGIDYYIHAFNMPLFFIVAGYFYKNNTNLSFWQNTKKKMRALLVPYLFFGILHYIFFIIIHIGDNENLIEPLKHLFFINFEGIPIAGALWFLTALFFTQIFYDILYRKVKNRYVFLCIIIFFSLVGTLVPIRLPYSIDAALVGIGLFYIGNCIKRYEERDIIRENIHGKIFITLGMLLVNLLLIFLNGYVNMRNGQYSCILLFWINAILGTITWWNVAYTIEKFKDKNAIINNIWKLNRFIGENSIVFLCLNQIVIKVLIESSERIIGINVCISFLIMLFTLMILSLITIIFKSTKLKVLIGKS